MLYHATSRYPYIMYHCAAHHATAHHCAAHHATTHHCVAHHATAHAPCIIALPIHNISYIMLLPKTALYICVQITQCSYLYATKVYIPRQYHFMNTICNPWWSIIRLYTTVVQQHIYSHSNICLHIAAFIYDCIPIVSWLRFWTAYIYLCGLLCCYVPCCVPLTGNIFLMNSVYIYSVYNMNNVECVLMTFQSSRWLSMNCE